MPPKFPVDPRGMAGLLATMSHELRTPMNGVLGMAELLDDTVLTGEQREYLDVLTSSARSLLRVVDDILDYAQIASGALSLVSQPFHLHRAIGESLRLLAPSARAKGVELAVAVDPALPEWVTGDVGRVRQVMSNLTAHAIAVTPSGLVSVEIRPGDAGGFPEGRARIDAVVRETGVNVWADAGGASGLGVTIAQRLLDMMGGRIWVEETAEGSECHFTFGVDVAPEPPASAPLSAAASTLDLASADEQGRPRARRDRFRDMRVLVAEDNPINQQVMTLMLEGWGARVTVASSGRQVLEAIDRAPFDLVLMDVQMPDGDGFETTAAIRAREAGRDRRVPIIALTAQRGDRARCLAADMDDYLSKPVVPAELAGIFDRMLAADGSRA